MTHSRTIATALAFCASVAVFARAESRRVPVDSLARLERVAEVERALGRAELCWKVKKQQLCQWHRPAAPWAGDELWLTCSVQGDALVHCDLEFSGGRR